MNNFSKIVDKTTTKASQSAGKQKVIAGTNSPKTNKKRAKTKKGKTPKSLSSKKSTPTTAVKKKAVAPKTNKSVWDAVNRKIDRKLQQMKKRSKTLGNIPNDNQPVTFGMLKEIMPIFLEPLYKEIKEIRKEIKEIRKEIGGITNQLGKESEQYFSELINQDPQFKKLFPFKNINENVKNKKKISENGNIDKKNNFEFDIIVEGINPRRILIIEVKRRFETKDLQNFMKKPIHQFINENPQYKNMKIHLGIAAYSYEKNAMENAKKKGVFVFKKSPIAPYDFPKIPKNFNEKK